MSYAVYGYSDSSDSLLLVYQISHDTFWVVNGEWQLERENGIFLHPLTKQPLDIKLLGYIDYDGDYSSTLERFRCGEGQHTSAPKVPIVTVQEPELCKRKYYGIECSCSKCKR